VEKCKTKICKKRAAQLGQLPFLYLSVLLPILYHIITPTRNGNTIYSDGTGTWGGDGQGQDFTWWVAGDVLTMDVRCQAFGDAWTETYRYQIVGDALTFTHADGWQQNYFLMSGP